MFIRIKFNITFLDPTARIKYNDRTFAELAIMVMISVRLIVFTNNNIAYQNHITKNMYWVTEFGARRHLKFLVSGFDPVPNIFKVHRLARGKTLFNAVPFLIQFRPSE